MLYLMKNGEPGNAGIPTGDQYPWFIETGFLECPTRTFLYDLISFSDFNLVGASGSGSPLPIELISFYAMYQNNVVNIMWETASEINNDYFIVEKSTDAINFIEIDKIYSLANNGNSNSMLNYISIDRDIKSGIIYYRLKQYDLDGTYSYSNIISIVINQNGIFTIYPNPTKDIIEISYYCNYNDKAIVKLYDEQGKLILTQQIECVFGENKTVLDLSNIAPSVYTLTLITKDSVENAKLIKQ